MAAVIHIGDLDLVPAGPGTDNTDRCKIANLPQANIGIIFVKEFRFSCLDSILNWATFVYYSR